MKGPDMLNAKQAERDTLSDNLTGYGFKALFVNALVALVVLLAVPSNGWAQETKTILALGDSLTAGYGLAHEDGFVPQLERALKDAGADVKVINGGVSGDTSAGGRSRLLWLLSTPVDLVIVELGANDGLRGLDPAQTRENIGWIVGALKSRSIPVLLSGMQAPPNLGSDYGKEFNSIYPDIANRYDVALDPFFLEGVAAVAALNQADGIHPNAEGVGVIVKRLVPDVLALLNF